MPQVQFGEKNQNLNLYYELHGSGETKIIFIMGLLTDGGAWVAQSTFFREQAEYQCVTYDNRGCGRSSSPRTVHYTTTQMAKDAIALIDHLEWSKCHVVGVSMGGMISLEFALLVPERMLSLALLATHAGGLAGRAPFVGVRLILESIVISKENLQIQNTLDMLYGSKTLADPEKEKRFRSFHTERYRKRVPPTIIGIFGHLLAVQRHFVSYADLLKIRYSTFDCLIMVGTEDRLVREENSYLLQKTLGCRLIKLEDAGHGLPGERSDEVNKELYNWYESIRTNNPPPLKREVPAELQTEIKALEQCCQHRTHCLVYNIVGFIQGLFFGVLAYFSLSLFNLNFENMILLFGVVGGLRRSLKCIYHAFHARRYVHGHQLILDRAARHGGIGVALPGEPKTGIPDGCGFEFPFHSILFTLGLITLFYCKQNII